MNTQSIVNNSRSARSFKRAEPASGFFSAALKEEGGAPVLLRVKPFSYEQNNNSESPSAFNGNRNDWVVYSST